LFRIACWSALVVIVVGGLAGVAVWRELTMDLPKVTELLDYRPPTATSVLASDGTKIGEFYLERRYLIPIDDVPLQVRQAFPAPRHRSRGHRSGDDRELPARRDRAGREHDHAAGSEAAPADVGAELRAQRQGDDPCRRARLEAHEGRDLLPLPEPHLFRRAQL